MTVHWAGTISERIAQIKSSLPDSVRLIAVTKQVPIEAMREAYAAGIRDFGESKVQEAEIKQRELADLPDVVWHLIGHLQTNKAQKALQCFQWIHSVDSLKLALRLDRLAASLTLEPQICLQVKLLPDPDKYGWTAAELLADLAELNQCQYLQIKGLMTIPPTGLSEVEVLELFEQNRQLANKIQAQNWQRIQMQDLSMGMSGDFPLAIQAGTTMIRLGRVLFGDRQA
ncbi:YggS family pyridoxal phosphate-dependent enzyme [Phormidium sp. CLA17]|uniref:YggS family pyridoxal phosphate-dependent enzyme n=1 Tax=Leptolyngbya sp. Cla-17 TaxID=2803751 RepID=UPI0014929D12|nr:YggS family pyridoxal phosphate-dependent enzyme [Leptolyngbya sp. Cla-17]MBM0740209.1 YggS family pyridoxal phosphate-dependent enzyme [Leptolyngbya sp. Cla-17]